jgi:hypothetical protein
VITDPVRRREVARLGEARRRLAAGYGPNPQQLVVQVVEDQGHWFAVLICGHRWSTGRVPLLEGSYHFCGLCRLPSFKREHPEYFR